MWRPDFFETTLRCNGFRCIAGVDEVGRGALAGPVVAAAVILPEEGSCDGIRDSKTLTAHARERLAADLHRRSRGVGIGSVPESEIDKTDIVQATYKAMRQAIVSLPSPPDMVLVDGFWLEDLAMPCIGIIKGDALSYSIGAASIVAKVHRDALLCRLAREYPAYGFERNKGYGTPEHLTALSRIGPCPYHRRSFQGVSPPGGTHGC